MKINKLLERLEYEVVRGSDKTEVTTLANDSRKVEKGSVFVCISAVSYTHLDVYKRQGLLRPNLLYLRIDGRI